MLDLTALQNLVEQQVRKEVADTIQKTITDEWLKTVEDNAIKFIQDRIVAKFANSEALPELVTAVKTSVKDLFSSGQLPGLGQYVDYDLIKQNVNDSTQELVKQAINELVLDQVWLDKIEMVINQNVIAKVSGSMANIELLPIVRKCVEEAINTLKIEVFKGLESHADAVELTLLDQHVVVENSFTAKDASIINLLTVNDLSVLGTINTDNKSWDSLADTISEKTFDKLNDQWKSALIEQVRESISAKGINFNNVKIDGQLLVNDGTLSASIVDSNLKSVGALKKLTVVGETTLSDTVVVGKHRVGINTAEPEMALSLWDEEVTISAGKFKQGIGFLGTTRKQGLAIGVNKVPAIEISDAGLTTVKQLQVGHFKITHGTEVPNYSGTKGDIVFNSNPGVDNPVFAWQCLGGFKWKIIKAVE